MALFVEILVQFEEICSWDFAMRLMKAKLLLLPVIAFLTITSALVAPGSNIPEDRGAMGLSQVLKRLDVIGSVLHTGAHPDDENSALLAWLARGQGVRTAYLSATRGEGGVNLVGPELFEALGVIRTEELYGARRLDHAQQFFTPNYEFGFSKSAEDTFGKWGREQILGDFVRVIRYFRPEIIISRFTGTPRDGHGHHQVAGIITQEAFKAAADPNRFPEYGKPWQAKKLYLNVGGGPGGPGGNDQPQTPPPGLDINTGEFDPALGRSYSEIATEGRSLHRSQAQGGAQERGPRPTRVQLVQKTVNVSDLAPLFSGVLYKLTDLAQLDSAISSDLTTLEQRITAIRQKVNLLRPAEIMPDLAAALKQLQQIKARATHEHVRFLLEQKEEDFQEAFRLASGLVIDVLASDDTLVPGQEFNLTVSVINGGPYEFSSLRATTDLPQGWDAVYDNSTGSLRPGQRLDQKFKVKVSPNAEFTQPYWLREPRRGDRFVWPASSTLPMETPLFVTRAEVDYQGTTISMKQPAEFRRVDRMYGEHRVALKVVPALSVTINPEIAIVPLTGNRRNNAGQHGRVSRDTVRLDGYSRHADRQLYSTGRKGVAAVHGLRSRNCRRLCRARRCEGGKYRDQEWIHRGFLSTYRDPVYLLPGGIQSRGSGREDQGYVRRLYRRNRRRYSRCAPAIGNECDSSFPAGRRDLRSFQVSCDCSRRPGLRGA